MLYNCFRTYSKFNRVSTRPYRTKKNKDDTQDEGSDGGDTLNDKEDEANLSAEK
jgi:hypothetical protein